MYEIYFVKILRITSLSIAFPSYFRKYAVRLASEMEVFLEVLPFQVDKHGHVVGFSLQGEQTARMTAEERRMQTWRPVCHLPLFACLYVVVFSLCDLFYLLATSEERLKVEDDL